MNDWPHAVAVALAIMLLVALACVALLVLRLPQQIAKMILAERSLRDAAAQGQARAEAEQARAVAERDAIREAARAELSMFVGQFLFEQKEREHAEEGRAAMQEAARQQIRAAFLAAQGDYARLVDELRGQVEPLAAIASIARDLHEDRERLLALFWYLWRLLAEARPGGPPPPQPPKFTGSPDAEGERRARPPAEPRREAQPPRLSDEDRARIRLRYEELVRAAAERGQHLHHCEGVFCEQGVACECQCDPCIGLHALWEQAAVDVFDAGLRAARLRPPPVASAHSSKGAAPAGPASQTQPSMGVARPPAAESLQ